MSDVESKNQVQHGPARLVYSVARDRIVFLPESNESASVEIHSLCTSWILLQQYVLSHLVHYVNVKHVFFSYKNI